MDSTTYNALNKYCSSVGLEQDRANRSADSWRNQRKSLTVNGTGLAFMGSQAIIASSTDGSSATLLVDQNHDVTIISAQEGQNKANEAVVFAYGCKKFMNNMLNPPKPGADTRSAH